jgi:hypothetical protein
MSDDQADVVIVDAAGTEHVFPPGFNPRHAAAIVRNGGSAALPSKPASAEDFTEPTTLQRGVRIAKDLGIGAAKGLGSTVTGLSEMAVNAGAVPGVTPAAFNSAMRHPVFQRAEDATTASNTTQRVGKVAEQVGEAVLPMAAGANAVPRMARAGRTFQSVMGAAKDVPLNVEAPGQVALRIQELAERGGTMPRMVRQFVQRVTDPAKAPLAYGEGRDFASNISRLSADEYNRLTPVIQREVGSLRTALNGSLHEAAGSVGKGTEYANAMKEYSQAAKLNTFRDALLDALKKGAVPAGSAAGAGYYLGGKLRGLLGGE